MKNTNQIILDKNQLEDMKIMIQVGKFSFNILHDLINPITGLALYLDTIKDESLKKDLKPIFEANTEIRGLLKTFQNTVDKPGVQENVDVSETIKSALVLMRHKALKNHTTLSFGQNISNLKIKINKLNFYQIILNLVGNSIDSFSDLNDRNKNRKRFVTVSLSENLKNYRLTIADNGSGIKKSHIEKIFDKNFTTKTHGFGIGLHTVRDIIENEIGGEIKIKTKWQTGTKFHIYIPKKL
jgi:C4-dicarboxylate-specific signal transduction histidine kinase